MPPSRKRASIASEDVEDVADGSSPPPQTKKLKTKKEPITTANARQKADDKALISTSMQHDENSDPFWELSAGGTRRVTVNTFKGVVMVSIREYYESNGKKLPGKKGISMPVDQWAALMEALPQIDKLLKEKGEDVPRPRFDATTGDEEQQEKSEGTRKRNFEATSDEDEG